MSRPDTARFAELQRRLVAVQTATRARRRRTMVVVPSRIIDKWHEPPIESRALEERLLCLLLMLRDPGLRIVYVTSLPVPAASIDYQLSLLPRAVRASARARLALVSTGDPSQRPLSEKLLKRPSLLHEIRRRIASDAPCHLVPYATTDAERELALALDAPLYGADPHHAHLGTKSGSRKLFARAAVPHPLGVEGVSETTDLVAAIQHLRATKPQIAQVVVKLDEGVSGDGNAIVDVCGLPSNERDCIAERVDRMVVEAGVSATAFLEKLSARGGIVEERITGLEVRSPSVQVELTPLGAVEIVSTHDQLLGGHNGHSYLGCRFPAEPAYAAAITRAARRVGSSLADAGVVGRCAVDFVVTRDARGTWHPYAIELNLRKGGTTHPFATLARLTGGTYDPATATFTTALGVTKHYVASDNLSSPLLHRLGHADLFDLIRRRRLGFDHLRQRGVVFHMLSALEPLGRIGLTAIGDTAAEAERHFERARVVLLLAAAARTDLSLAA